jgi:two-component system, OmpR family, phosphate regulon response regulator PhoB
MNMNLNSSGAGRFEAHEVVASVAAAYSESSLIFGGLVLNNETCRVYANGLKIKLGPTEFRLLHFLMAHAERVYSRTQLLEQVWDKRVLVEQRTIDVHIRHLRATLEPAGLNGLIQTVRGRGYRFSLSG